MKQTIICFLAVISMAACNNGKEKMAINTTTTSSTQVEENADSSRYMNMAQNGTHYTYSKMPNTILLANGMQLEVIKIDRMAIPDKLKVLVMMADAKDKVSDYELADITIKATNTSGNELQFNGSNIMCAEFTLYSTENNYKNYREQADLSAGNVYINTDPMDNDKFTQASKSFIALYNQPYKAGETKTGNGMVIPVAKVVKKFGYLTLKTRADGQYETYCCSINL